MSFVESEINRATEIGVDAAADETLEGVRRRTPLARALYGDLVQFIDFVAITVASVAVAYFYHTNVIIASFDFQSYAAAGIIGATGFTTLLRRDGFYDFEMLLSSSQSMRAVIARWSLVVLGLLAFAFALKMSIEFSRFWLFAWTGVSMAVIVSTRIIAAMMLRRLSTDGGVFSRRVAIVGANELGEKFAEHARNSERGVGIVGVYDAGLSGKPADANPVRGGLAELGKAARNGEIDDIVIAISGATADEMALLVRRLSTLPVSIAISPNAHWLDHAGGEIARIGDASLLSLYRRPLEGWGGIIKNIEDRLLGFILIILASPLFVLAAFAVKLQGKGPILFSQKRHGFNHEVFKIYKFRTMTVAEDGDEIVQAKLGDARITPVGAFFRRYSIDELPQLFNVLFGHMSLVGPRPHALAHNHQYAQTVENYSGRHKVKPGITGWAQVNGLRGETSENEMMAERVRYDLEYVDNWSLWFDFKILLLTVSAVLFPKNAH